MRLKKRDSAKKASTTPVAVYLLSIASTLFLAMSGCRLGPHYHRPDVPVPATWQEADENSAVAAWPSAEWWMGFDSSQLNDLMAEARRANDDLAAAVARVSEADAQARIAGAPLLPSLQAGVTGSDERAQTSSGFQTYTSYGPLMSASYALDFWGKNRAAHAAAVATATASRFDRTTVELTVSTGVANSYFQALSLQERLDIAQNNLDTAEILLKGLQLEEEAGTANALDVAQQATTVATLNAVIPPLRRQLRQTLDALAILIGETPESLVVRPTTLADLVQPQVGAGLPSELLARRPDVAEAEAQLIAANADVQVARAAFFPSISLTADGGYTSSQLAGLVSPEGAVFSVGASLVQPIFEGGALRGQSEYAKARYRELLADYHKAVISAFGNVEDALAGVQQTGDQLKRQQLATDAARRAYQIAEAQLRAGTINTLTLLNTETALFTAQDALAQVRLSHFQSLVDLYGALGGGWQQTGQQNEARR